jgi:hypothetical protein
MKPIKAAVKMFHQQNAKFYHDRFENYLYVGSMCTTEVIMYIHNSVKLWNDVHVKYSFLIKLCVCGGGGVD